MYPSGMELYEVLAAFPDAFEFDFPFPPPLPPLPELEPPAPGTLGSISGAEVRVQHMGHDGGLSQHGHDTAAA